MGKISSYCVNRDLALIHVTDDAIKDVDISCAKLGNDLPVKRTSWCTSCAKLVERTSCAKLVGALGAPLSMRNCFTHGVLRLFFLLMSLIYIITLSILLEFNILKLFVVVP